MVERPSNPRAGWPVPGDRLPTLTEVLDLAVAPDGPGPAAAAVPLPVAPLPDGAPVSAPAVPVPDDSPPAGALPPERMPQATELTAEVLFELEQRIDSLFESRLREALAPALARVADGLIREARQELSGTLRALVEDAVTRAIERHTHL